MGYFHSVICLNTKLQLCIIEHVCTVAVHENITLKQFYLFLQNLVEHLRPKRVVFLTDVDGIYDKPPEKEGQ